jgi:Family of unknown function (DUF6118)
MADDEGGDDAAQAFEELRAEVTLMRRAVERLAAERLEMPEPVDYSETLGKLTKLAAATFQKVDAVAASPALAMTPEQMAGRIAGAASTIRQEDRQTIATARTGLEDVTRRLHGYVVSARRGDEQNRWLAYAGLGGTVLGMVLWALCAGPIAHLAPASWRWPEKMASRTLDLPMWEAGRHLLIMDSPESWNALADGWNIVQGNRKAIEGCRKAAAKAKEAVRCTVSIAPAEKR